MNKLETLDTIADKIRWTQKTSRVVRFAIILLVIQLFVLPEPYNELAGTLALALVIVEVLKAACRFHLLGKIEKMGRDIDAEIREAIAKSREEMDK